MKACEFSAVLATPPSVQVFHNGSFCYEIEPKAFAAIREVLAEAAAQVAGDTCLSCSGTGVAEGDIECPDCEGVGVFEATVMLQCEAFRHSFTVAPEGVTVCANCGHTPADLVVA